MVFFEALNQYGASAPIQGIPAPVAPHAFANTPAKRGASPTPTNRQCQRFFQPKP